MRNEYDRTLRACFVGYIVQAIVVTYAPLLFLTFQESYGVSLSKITLLVTINFLLQLCIDAASVKLLDRIGYRAATLIAHGASAAGLVLMTILPEAMPDPYAGLLISVCMYALGGGLLEVVISPMVEACPTPHKARAMSMLHSFYCWGYMGVTLISTLFFAAFGIRSWKVLTLLWTIVPIVNGIAFLKAPIAPLLKEGERGMSLKELAGKRLFWLMLVAMLCSGASEQAVSQWASMLAERGLGVNKTLGDLMGPMFFALSMGVARTIYGKCGGRFPLEEFMLASCGLCVAAYLMISLSPWPVVGLLGCGLCGFSVGIFWPGTLSLASAGLRRGGTALFCLLALGGDLGCSLGPTVAGMVSSAAGDNLKAGILAAVAFPLILTLCVAVHSRSARGSGGA